MSFGVWLSRTFHLLRSNYRIWKWSRIPGELAIQVKFAEDDIAKLSAAGVQILEDGPQAFRLAEEIGYIAINTEAISSDEKFSHEAPSSLEEDDSPGFP